MSLVLFVWPGGIRFIGGFIIGGPVLLVIQFCLVWVQLVE